MRGCVRGANEGLFQTWIVTTVVSKPIRTFAEFTITTKRTQPCRDVYHRIIEGEVENSNDYWGIMTPIPVSKNPSPLVLEQSQATVTRKSNSSGGYDHCAISFVWNRVTLQKSKKHDISPVKPTVTYQLTYDKLLAPNTEVVIGINGSTVLK